MTATQELPDIARVRDMRFHMDGTRNTNDFDDDVIQNIADGRIILCGDRVEGEPVPPFIIATEHNDLHDLSICWADMSLDDSRCDVFLPCNDQGRTQIVHLAITKNIQESADVECGPNEPFDLLTNLEENVPDEDRSTIIPYEVNPKKFETYINTVFPGPAMMPRLISPGTNPFAPAVIGIPMGETRYLFIGNYLGAQCVEMTIFKVERIDDVAAQHADTAAVLTDVLAEAQRFVDWHQHDASTNHKEHVAVCYDMDGQCIQAGLLTQLSSGLWTPVEAPSLSITIATDVGARSVTIQSVDDPHRGDQVVHATIPPFTSREGLHDMVHHILMTWLNRIDHTGATDTRSFIYANTSAALTFDILEPSLPRNVLSIRNTAEVGAHTTDEIKHGHQLLILNHYHIWEADQELNTLIDGHAITLRLKRTAQGDADPDGIMIPVIDLTQSDCELILGGTVTGSLISVRSDEFDNAHPLCQLHGSWQVWFVRGRGDAIMIPANPESTMLHATGRRFADTVCLCDQVDAQTLDPMRFFTSSTSGMEDAAPEAASEDEAKATQEHTQEEHHEQ